MEIKKCPFCGGIGELTMDEKICSRCGKIIQKEERQYTVSMSNIEDKKQITFWCEKCYLSFVEDFNGEHNE